MVKKLNLRKNKIGDRGVKELAKFIANLDTTLVDVNLNRNRLSEEGILFVLDAINSTLRIQNFEISFGNQMSDSSIVAFDQEIQANIQIKQNLKEDLGIQTVSVKQILEHEELAKKIARKKFSVNDKGPSFLRCAIKKT